MLTKKQKMVLDFVKQSQKKNGYSPSLVEIQQNFKFASVSTAHFHIKHLQKKGLLTKEENQPRTISAMKEKSTVEIPLLGNIAAGEPIEAIEINEKTITIPRSDIKMPFQHYALRVKGDSMIEDGIFDGDIVVVRSQNMADNGQTAVAIIDDNQATLKKIYKEKNKIRLQPANKNLRPFYRKQIEIRGVVEKIIRTL
ncbi:MAG: transcriptional repressor LexA [Candidatus Paceibacterota bacterium]|jgi:repressor LexA